MPFSRAVYQFVNRCEGGSTLGKHVNSSSTQSSLLSADVSDPVEPRGTRSSLKTTMPDTPETSQPIAKPTPKKRSAQTTRVKFADEVMDHDTSDQNGESGKGVSDKVGMSRDRGVGVQNGYDGMGFNAVVMVDLEAMVCPMNL